MRFFKQHSKVFPRGRDGPAPEATTKEKERVIGKELLE